MSVLHLIAQIHSVGLVAVENHYTDFQRMKRDKICKADLFLNLESNALLLVLSATSSVLADAGTRRSCSCSI